MTVPGAFSTALQKWIAIFMHNSMRGVFLFAKANGLSMSQLGALFHVVEGCSGVSDIGGDLGISSPAASQMIERLVQQGLITRSEDPNDRRAKQIVLTEHGKQIVQESMRARSEWIDVLANKLSPAEQDQAAVVLTVLASRAGQPEEQPDP
jgi:DNA-binding MarR family transcriptional regulator